MDKTNNRLMKDMYIVPSIIDYDAFKASPSHTVSLALSQTLHESNITHAEIVLKDNTHDSDSVGVPIMVSKLHISKKLVSRVHKLLFLLGTVASEYQEHEEVKNFIDYTEKATKLGKAYNEDGPSNITLTIPLKKLAQFMNGRATTRDIDCVIKDLEYAAQYKMRMVLPEGLVSESATIQINNIIIDTLKKGRDVIEITFGKIFFWNLRRRFVKIPFSLFSEWGNKTNGTSTALFPYLLESILNVLQVRISKWKESNNENELVYSLNYQTIKNDLSPVVDYTSTREQTRRLKQDLTKCCEVFIKFGFIKDYDIVKGANGQDKVVFFLNEKFNSLLNNDNRFLLKK